MLRLINRIRKLLIDTLAFSKTEANGFLILLLITILIALVPYFMKQTPNSTPEDDDEFSRWVDEIENSIRKKEATIAEEKVSPKIQISSFDPNADTFEQLIAAGIPEKAANTIINYRSKGGTFRDKSDLKKMYSISDELFQLMEPFIDINESSAMDEKPDFNKDDRPVIEINLDLNEATAEELQQIRGIGPVLSERIEKYRANLGGFTSYEQLGEIYGLKPEAIDQLILHSNLSPVSPSLRINEIDSLKTLVRHPYIDYKLAGVILNYRKVHGPFKSVEELRNIKILSDSLYHRLAPYISL